MKSRQANKLFDPHEFQSRRRRCLHNESISFSLLLTIWRKLLGVENEVGNRHIQISVSSRDAVLLNKPREIGITIPLALSAVTVCTNESNHGRPFPDYLPVLIRPPSRNDLDIRHS